ncbi:MAG: DUF1127 domain-containing protein [Ruegeria sp.]|uniref:DUF1127 domain-containing protein n=1 Tax=Ruegeria sp. TaxID=1879320 RepID=UPI00349EE7D5
MAHSTAQLSSFHGLVTAVADIFSGIFDALVRIGEANSKVRQIEALSALSDEDLAARGIAREDIIRHVLSDVV